MIKNLLAKALFTFLLIGCFQTTEAQIFKKKDKKAESSDTKEKSKKGEIESYEKVITKDAKTDKGLFDVHIVDDNHYYEIPDSLFNKEMLMVSRISKTATGIGFGGGKINTKVLRWEKLPKKVLLRVVSYDIVAADSLPVSEAVVNSNFEPVLYSFDIKAFKKDSLNPATVIQVNDLFEKDVNALGMPDHYRKEYKVSRLDESRSYISTLKSYPLNIEARHVKTYVASNPPSNGSLGSISIEINNSMILLPEEPMKRRYFDKRVGWFARGQVDYGLDAQESKTVRFLDRWRLEVKDEDIEKYKNGELVEPKKPIVYYVDRATPKSWVPFIKQGIEDWQVAFEAAGFKNAILAKDPPTPEEDPEWSPEDVRYSVVRYLASPIPNANGPHVSDPRTGEILESDINWYHNVMTLLRNWFFVQTAAINPDARSVAFKEEVMGRLIRFVSSHEVGHTLGLPHNMGSSIAYPVDSLRSASFTKKYGTAPSIMDYARFNYIAQPGDEGVALMPEIGVYDKYAIAWGYRPILDKSDKEEKETLDSWILKHSGDPLYRFGHQQVGDVVDPSSQTEDLGDNAIKASAYGIENLKRITPKLIEWTAEKGKEYDDLNTMYGQVISQFNRYMGHVSNNIGGVYEQYKTYDQEGAVYTPVDREHQKNCLLFVQEQLFQTPEWLIVPNIFNKIEYSGSVERIRSLQVRTLDNILSLGKLARLIENETANGKDAYSLLEMMTDLRKGLWSETRNGRKIDTYRRNLQKAHIERLGYLLTTEDDAKKGNSGGYQKSTPINTGQSDIRSIARAELNILRKDLKNAINRTVDPMSKYHLQDAVEQIELILNPNS
ncbi:zinc-dependent metalloprotease [Arenibacter sp. S6351L]|uniref:zinc-dependent metalloprotease n=1 Tax=Arenibacter sp. S6351L TaxID=2926407 RepID=UPI001FF64287|nr:zinc-dependent metalloprotease [Arenibacter sp. S6351L]MCK0136559.1 zinc-dependent metalloprotease [Arenibacter sp. S6351L]